MKEKLTKNFGLKLLSICLAFFIWLVVINVSNPEVVRTKEVPLEQENERVLTAAGKTYELIGKNTVTVSYSVRARDEYMVRASDFRAYIDLAELYDITGAVPVKIDVLNNRELVSNVTARTPSVRVETEDLRQKRFNLTSRQQGEAAEDFEVGEISLNPKYIYVSGPASEVNQIGEVVVDIDVTDLDSDDAGIVTPKLLDEEGNELSSIDRVTLNNSQIEYSVTIHRVKNLNLDFEVSGTVASGYRFVGVESDVRTVSVQGLKTTLANLNRITIPASALSVEGASSDRRVTVDLQEYLPEGVTIVSPSTTIVEVRLNVERLQTRRVVLDAASISFNGGNEDYQYVIAPEQVELTVQGLGEDLDSLTPATFGAVLDVTGFEPGNTYPGTLTTNRSDVYEVVSVSPFNVITALDGEEVDTETSVSTSDATGEETDEDEPESAEVSNDTNVTSSEANSESTSEATSTAATSTAATSTAAESSAAGS